MQKANAIAQAAGHDDFKVTDGWFSCWKHRHNLTFTTLKCEAAEADKGGAENFRRATIQEILETYYTNDIYNADETILYFRALPGSTYVENARKFCKKALKQQKTG